MKRVSNRSLKVASLIRKELALLIERQVRDPQLKMINLTAVELSPDFSAAKVYFTIVGSSVADEIKQQQKLLNKASGYLRSLLVNNIQLKKNPKIVFSLR